MNHDSATGDAENAGKTRAILTLRQWDENMGAAMTDRLVYRNLVAVLAMIVTTSIVTESTAQSPQADTKTLAFEVATIKRSDPSASRMNCFIKGQPGGQTFVGSCVSLRLLIKYAYRIIDSQLVGGPDWLDTEFYDFRAKADHSLTRAELPPIFQALVEDRFKLKFHRETRTLPALALTVDKAGAKMKANDSPDEWAISIVNDGGGPPPKPPKFKGTRCAMSYLSWWIAQRENRPVLDRTGLAGFWDFTLEFVPDGMGDEGRRKGSGGEALPAFDGPTLYTALREQLGLKLESTKGPVDVYVIDHVERATAN